MSRGEAGGWLDTAPGASFCRDRRSGQMLGGEQQREFYVDLRCPYAPPPPRFKGWGQACLFSSMQPLGRCLGGGREEGGVF